MGSLILELRNVRKEFHQDLLKPRTTVLKDVSCGFERGIATAILGHNGAGKTTSLRILLGLMKADTGEILFEGRSMLSEDRRRIGYMPETNKLPSELRAEELLYFHLNLYKPELNTKTKKLLVDERLNAVGIVARHRSKKIAFLSKGLGRRLAWAMANIHDPDVLVLDEPFSGLDPLGRQDLGGWIKESLHKGKSVIMTTHDIDSARRLCSRLPRRYVFER